MSDASLVAVQVCKSFRRQTGEVDRALVDVSLQAARGNLTALVGPDGAGKTTLLRLAAGLMTADSGKLTVLGVNVERDPQQVQNRIGYMPQRFGLYEDLTVRENLDLYADLHGVTAGQRRQRYPRLMEMTALEPFGDRLAGKLSGGMKQKLGLACTLVCSPELLLLDEPTVGVDPLSRRELWDIILGLVHEQSLTVLLSTSYLDEAERATHVVVLHHGQVLAQGPPTEISSLAAGHTFLAKPAARQTARAVQARLLDIPNVVDAVPEGGQVRFVLDKTADAAAVAGGAMHAEAVVAIAPRFEDGFMVLLRQAVGHRALPSGLELGLAPGGNGEREVVAAHDLVRRFGAFTAVDHISFAVRRGEVFGLLGPNGAGKTTTFRMLCGLLPATSGTLRVADVDLRIARASARQRIGYVAQKFSLYGQLSVLENLEFFAGAYGLRGAHQRRRIAWAMEQFELGDLARLPSVQLPGGYKQRLAMAAALLHEPDILFLDEPTSGVDPLARREFWRRITALAEQGVTVIVTTHFMEEAEYCDRVAILDAGRILAQGTPAEIRQHAVVEHGDKATMEEAFIAIVEEARRESPANGKGSAAAAPAEAIWLAPMPAKARRVWSLVRKESRQIVRDSSSIAIGIVLPVLLILLFGYGLSLDVKDSPLAVVLEDVSPESTELAAAFQLSPSFQARLMTSMPYAERLMLAREVDAIIRIRPDFGRQVKRGGAEVQILVHGTDANRARILQSYAQGAVAHWAAERAIEARDVVLGPVVVRDRLWFNEANESRYFLVPGLIVLIMTLIGALLTALVMAREWERGTLESLFVTPVRVGEILLGKTIPYFVLGLIGLALCIVTARYLFHVPLRGSLLLLIGSSMLYLLVALGIGLLISSAAKNQFFASQITILATFLPAVMMSGFLFDIRSMPVSVRVISYIVPARYFVALLQTIFLAGNVRNVVALNGLILAVMATLLLMTARLETRKKLG
jgi:ABC-2 type transport system permease protein